MKPPPPMFPAWGSVTAKEKPIIRILILHPINVHFDRLVVLKNDDYHWN